MGHVRGPPFRGLLWQMSPPRRTNGMAEAHRRDRARALDRVMLQHSSGGAQGSGGQQRCGLLRLSIRPLTPGLLHLRIRCRNRIPCFLSHSTRSGSSAGMGDHPARMLLATPCMWRWHVPACLLVVTAERWQIGLQARGKNVGLGQGLAQQGPATRCDNLRRYAECLVKS